MSITLETVLKAHFVDALARRVCGDNYEIVTRHAAVFLKAPEEEDRDIYRVIILPPKGYTANEPDQMNSHEEADYAKIEVKGGVREGRRGFSKLKDCLFVASAPEHGKVSDLTEPYLTYDLESPEPDLVTELHSAGEAPFTVVRNDGFGFYHNLVNRSDGWLVMVLHKRLRPAKKVDLEPHLATVQDEYARLLKALYESVVKHGDRVFQEEPSLVADVKKIPLSVSLPALGEMLYVHDSGMHEACTVFAIILDLGKSQPEAVSEFLAASVEAKAVPAYYAGQLIEKIKRAGLQEPTSTSDRDDISKSREP